MPRDYTSRVLVCIDLREKNSCQTQLFASDKASKAESKFHLPAKISHRF